MSRPINISETLTFAPTSNVSTTNMTASSSYPAANGYTDASSTTYTRFSVTRNQVGSTYYVFTVTGIPSGATISSVSCVARIYVNSTTNVSSTQIQLYSGTTAKGTSKTFASTTDTNTVTLDGGSWTVAELENARLYFKGTGGGNNNSSRYIYFYGATLSVTYSLQGTEYEITSTLATDAVSLIDPAGQTYVAAGNDYELNIYIDSVDNIVVEDNGTDITSSLVRHNRVSSGDASAVLGTYTLVSGSFNGSGSTFFQGLVGKGENASTTTSNYYSGGSGTITVFTYNLSFNDVPDNATITRLYLRVNGHAESTSNSSEYMCVQLLNGSTAISDELNFKSIGTSNTTQTIEATTLPTVAQLSNLKVQCRLGYYGGAINGATCYVEYTVPGEGLYYWTYGLTNIQADHTIVISDSIIEIPEEDPQYEYYPITISSINATTSPGRGTTRVVEGTNQTITIYPSDPLVTLVTDNGINISNQLVQHGSTISQPTVTTASGASYGFNLNSSTGYYVSQNAGQSGSAAVCRVTFNLPVRCLVTIQYINYAEATYDYGIFGNIDTALGTTSSADSNAYRTLSSSSDNSDYPETLTYEIPSGEHYIDIKFRKDNYTDSNNDTLQWKILSIEPLEANNYYTYTISNIQEAHSLIFIFGDVTYYFVNSSGSGAKLFPDGSMVQLPGDLYSLTIVPDDYSYEISVLDNNTDVTSQVQRKEEEITKNGATYTIVNYIYRLSNIQATHNIVVQASASQRLYIKINSNFTQASSVYKKVNGQWVEQTDLDSLFERGQVYISSN